MDFPEIIQTMGTFLSSLGATVILSSIMMFFKVGIDALNITEVEKAMLPLSGRVVNSISQTFVFSFVFSIVFLFVMVLDRTDNINLVNVVVAFVIIFILISVLLGLSFYLVFSLISFWSIKVSFYIRDEKNKSWKIERRVDKEKLLLSKKNNKEYKFIKVTDIIGEEITTELIDKNFSWLTEVIISNINIAKISTTILFWITLFVIILINIFCSPNNLTMVVLLALYFIVVLLFLFVLVVNNNIKILNNFKDN